MKKTIVVHDRMSHVDEIVATGLYCIAKDLNKKETVIKRQNPNSIDTKTKAIFIDVGGEFDGKRLFDHHQNDQKVNDLSASGLVAKTFFSSLLDLNQDFDSFINRINIQDNNRSKLKETYNANWDNLKPFLAIEQGITSLFQEKPKFVVFDIIIPILQEMIAFEKKVIQASRFLKKYSRIVEINKFKVLIIKELFNDDIRALNKAQEPTIKKNKIDLVYSFNERLEGQIYRTSYGKKKGIDLNTVNPVNEIFTHKAGFLTVFDPTSKDEWKKLINEL